MKRVADIHARNLPTEYVQTPEKDFALIEKRYPQYFRGLIFTCS